MNCKDLEEALKRLDHAIRHYTIDLHYHLREVEKIISKADREVNQFQSVIEKLTKEKKNGGL